MLNSLSRVSGRSHTLSVVTRSGIRFAFSATKIQLDMARSGAECLKLTQNQHYDAILMDHLMPEMDEQGFRKVAHTVCRNQKRNPFCLFKNQDIFPDFRLCGILAWQSMPARAIITRLRRQGRLKMLR